MMYLTWYLVFVEAPFRQPEKFTSKFAYSTFWSLSFLRDIKFNCFLMARQLQQHLIFIVSNYVTTVFSFTLDKPIYLWRNDNRLFLWRTLGICCSNCHCFCQIDSERLYTRIDILIETVNNKIAQYCGDDDQMIYYSIIRFRIQNLLNLD